jgi:hypothetical protein
MGYAGALVAIACYLSLASGLARAQDWWSAPTDIGGGAISSGPSAVATTSWWDLVVERAD